MQDSASHVPQASRAVHKKQRKQKKGKVATNREAHSQDLLVAAFKDADSQQKGAVDALKETIEVVKSNDLGELKKQIDRLEQEKADLSSQIPAKNSQLSLKHNFTLTWEETLSTLIEDVNHTQGPMMYFTIVKIIMMIFHLIEWFGWWPFFIAYVLTIPPLLAHAAKLFPISTCLWNLLVLKGPGKINWRLHFKLHRKNLFFAMLFFLEYNITYVAPYLSKEIYGGINGPLDIILTIFIFVAYRYLCVTYTKFTTSHIKTHRYDINPNTDTEVSDLRTETMKKGKMVYMDPTYANSNYTFTLHHEYVLEGVMNLSLDPVLSRWNVHQDLSELDLKGRKTFKVSIELLSQLNHLAITMPTEQKVAYDRIEFAAKNICAVNVNRFDFTEGDHILLHTVALAKGLYQQQRESVAHVPF
jgi:hypothetical protein